MTQFTDMPMTILFILLLVQIAAGAFDNIWHHEITEKLRTKPVARHELATHAAREAIYGVLFLGLAWWQWQGLWAIVLGGLFVVEIAVTIVDFLIEDRTRTLPPFERALHTLLAVNAGAVMLALAPVLWAWYVAPVGLKPAHYGLLSWLFTAAAIGVFAFALRDALATARLHILKVPEWQRAPFKRGLRAAPKTVLISGGTGLIGTALIRALVHRGDRVIVLTRDCAKAAYKFGPHVRAVEDLGDIADDTNITAIVNLAGEPLAGGLWTRRRKALFVDSRIGTTRALVDLIGRLARKPELLISGSAIGYYGNSAAKNRTEDDGAGEDYMAGICATWERVARGAETFGVRVCRLRIGLVLDRAGGILPPLALTVRFGLGAVMGTGRQWMSWIGLGDLVRLILFTLDEARVEGALNAVAPEPVSQRYFVKTLARQFSRPVLTRVPAIALRAGLGEMSDLMLNGQHVTPAKAVALGFRFETGRLDAALRSLFEKRQPLAAESTTPVRVFFNANCPACSAEIGHYEAQVKESGAALSFRDIHAVPTALEDYGLSQLDIERRFYVLDTAGRLLGGIDAFIVIWTRLPRYRWAARLLHWPVFRFLGAVIYDGALVPWLARRNKKRPVCAPDVSTAQHL